MTTVNVYPTGKNLIKKYTGNRNKFQYRVPMNENEVTDWLTEETLEEYNLLNFKMLNYGTLRSLRTIMVLLIYSVILLFFVLDEWHIQNRTQHSRTEQSTPKRLQFHSKYENHGIE